MRSIKHLLPGVLKRDLKRVYLLPRRLNAHVRALPDFIIIGAQRCGTSSLYAYLTQHPQIYASSYKEVHYFDKNYQRGEYWYRAQFPRKARMGASGITGEASPNYLYRPEVPPLIHDLLPEVKLVVVLRDPVKRAVSHYNYERKMGREVLSLADALEFERLQDAGDTTGALELGKKSADKKKFRSYMKRGLYHQQLSRYMGIFDENQILILRSEDLFEDTKQLIWRVYSFLGVDSQYSPADLSRVNSAKTTSNVAEEIVQELAAYYEKPNQLLYESVQRDFGWM